jgi:hypothetical protein
MAAMEVGVRITRKRVHAAVTAIAARLATAAPDMPAANAAVSKSCFIITLRLWFMLPPFRGLRGGARCTAFSGLDSDISESFHARRDAYRALRQP